MSPTFSRRGFGSSSAASTRPRLRDRRRAFREPAQRLLAASARGAVHVAPVRAERAVRASARRGSESRTPRTARRPGRATCAGRLRRLRRAARADRARARARSGSRSSARRRIAARSASGRSSASRSGRSATRSSSCCRRPRRRTRRCRGASAALVPRARRRASGLPMRQAVRALVLDPADRMLLVRSATSRQLVDDAGRRSRARRDR